MISAFSADKSVILELLLRNTEVYVSTSLMKQKKENIKVKMLNLYLRVCQDQLSAELNTKTVYNSNNTL